MKKVFSKIKKKKLLHIIFNNSKKNSRINISPEKEFLQACFLPMKKNQQIKPHAHFWKKNLNKRRIVQEVWVVMAGKAQITLYDLDNKVILRKVLNTGDFSITFEGAHKIMSLSNKTIVYEFKTGPYEGKKKDLKYL